MPCQCSSCRSEALRMGLSAEQCDFCKKEINVAVDKNVWYQFIEEKISCEPCYKKNYKVCRICGKTHLITDMSESGVNFRGENISVCKKCATTQFKLCGDCAKLSYKGDLTKHDDKHYCHECFVARFETCQVCRKIYQKSEVTHKVWRDSHKACDKCYAWFGPIIRYEHTTYLPMRGKGPLYYGIELEVEIEGHVKEKRGAKAQEIMDAFEKEYLVLKEDRSINCGFEICTAPSELKFHMDYWGKYFQKPATGLAAFSTEGCGLHVHASRAALSFLGIGKMLVFVNDEKNKPFIECIAGRQTNDYCRVYKKKHTDCSPIQSGRNEDRHEAINLQNSRTVELRIFKSTLKPESFYKALEFTDALVHFCMCGNFSIGYCKSVDNFVNYVQANRKDWPHLWAYILVKWLKSKDSPKAEKWINKYGFGILTNEV